MKRTHARDTPLKRDIVDAEASVADFPRSTRRDGHA